MTTLQNGEQTLKVVEALGEPSKTLLSEIIYTDGLAAAVLWQHNVAAPGIHKVIPDLEGTDVTIQFSTADLDQQTLTVHCQEFLAPFGLRRGMRSGSYKLAPLDPRQANQLPAIADWLPLAPGATLTAVYENAHKPAQLVVRELGQGGDVRTRCTCADAQTQLAVLPKHPALWDAMGQQPVCKHVIKESPLLSSPALSPTHASPALAQSDQHHRKPMTRLTKGKDQPTTDLTTAVVALSTATPKSLYQAESELSQLEALLAEAAESETTVSDEALEVAANAFLEATNAAKEAVERYCWLIFSRTNRSEQRRAQAKVWDDAAKELKAIAQQDEQLAQRLKRQLLSFFDRREITKLETNTFKLSARHNGGKQPLNIDETYPIHNIAQLYPNLVKFDVDKEAVRTFLENGGSLPFAELGERGRNLVIKP